MEKIDYRATILEKLDKGPATIGTLKKECKQGKKITNLRKTFHKLLKEGIIEVNGYDKEGESFKLDNILFKKVDRNYKNPIYVKGLLDNPLEDNNYFKIQQIFKTRMSEINQIYWAEIKELENITGKMPLKEAIDLGYIKLEDTYTKDDAPIMCADILKEYPQAKLLYLKRAFASKIACTTCPTPRKSFFFSQRNVIELFEGDKRLISFADRYESFFSHLPIDEYHEQNLFKHFVIGALREKGEEKEKHLWELASDLTDIDLTLFTQKLRIVEYIDEMDFDTLEEHLYL